MASSSAKTTAADIEVDPAVLADLEVDSYDSSGFATSTQSLTSSINSYVFENGRRYHAYYGTEKNHLPTDEKEQDRMDMHHEIMLQLLEGKLHLAPIGNSPQRILDIGTGTGIWAVDCADTYPSAEVIGTDLSPIQPSWVPPNLKFEVDDMSEIWGYKDDSFDFIHVRNLSQSVEDWDHLLRQIYRCTKPGGYFELAECEFTIKSDDGTAGPDFQKYMKLLTEACVKLNRPTVTADMAKDLLDRGGFEDVKVVTLKQPFGPWAKDERMKKIGAMVMLTADAGAEGYGLAMFTRVLGMTAEDSLALCQKTSAEIRNKNYHVWEPFHVAYGRKPLKASEDK
ncbi:Similar to Demethylmenaquinone methyltransferase; acc. no. Q9RRT0 [Pyronema omphalodes CBS 100304]|uniref:Similar to Demethylmenaquinone methyltransferase acc. no. Q9RRT0 n=1 Tax=Pyronema omphalodes (strain CBS 100304) TaxID=1076935 RepID=U4L940_PYROM|nr:Similar to Demethylmenaquinone methyltransferase; acc. no. Q9RRT0 [Pyronema omphalodes CBS 100304]